MRIVRIQTLPLPLTSVPNYQITQDHIMALQTKIWSNTFQQQKMTDLFCIPKVSDAYKFKWIPILVETGTNQRIAKTSVPQNYVQATRLCK